MGLFTGLALGAALAGGLFAGKKLAPKPQQEDSLQGTVPQPLVAAGMAPPEPPKTNRGQAQLAAAAAGRKQRRRATGGAAGRGSVTGFLLGSGIGTNASLQPKTLLGR